MLNQFKIKTKLLSTFILVSLIPLGGVSFIALYKATQALREDTIAKFTAIQETKRNHIIDYFFQLQTSVSIIKNDPYLQGTMTTLSDAYETNNNLRENSTWQTMVEFKEPPIKAMVEKNGFYDLLMVSKSGDIIYTVNKGDDLGMNVTQGDLGHSSLGAAFKINQTAEDEKIVFGDFEPYGPSQGEPAAFMMARIKDNYDEVVGYIAIRIPADKLNKIVQQRAGMGNTSESYLVGKTNGRTSLRSNRIVKKEKVGTLQTGNYIELAFKGNSGTTVIIDSTGVEEFVRYDPLNIPGANWAIITTGAADEIFEAIHNLRNTMIMLILAAIVLVISIALGVTSVIIKPIRHTVTMLKDIAQGEGDLTKRLDQASKDEMGEMAAWFNIFIEKIQEIIGQIIGNAKTLNSVSSGLSGIAGNMTEGVQSMSEKSEQVTGASRDMSENMKSVAAASEQTSANVNLIASAIEEMTSTVGEIAQNSELARNITGSAVNKANAVSVTVAELGSAAMDISNVTQTINDISQQTNLLALNATIEAARAGESGKGFAVVANEIKDLATQTATATQEIKQRIESIQSSTSDTVTHIQEITGVINGVNEIVATIAAAVEEQSVTSQEIAKNVANASLGIQGVNENVSQSSASANAISRDITEVNTSVEEIAHSSHQVRSSAEELSVLADKLHEMVGQFKVK